MTETTLETTQVEPSSFPTSSTQYPSSPTPEDASLLAELLVLAQSSSTPTYPEQCVSTDPQFQGQLMDVVEDVCSIVQVINYCADAIPPSPLATPSPSLPKFCAFPDDPSEQGVLVENRTCIDRTNGFVFGTSQAPLNASTWNATLLSSRTISIGCPGKIDACFQCNGGNAYLSHCGECKGSPSEVCDGVVLTSLPVDLSSLNLTDPIASIADLGDLDGDNITDIAIGIPSLDSVFILFPGPTGALRRHIVIDALNFPSSIGVNGSLFGTSLLPAGDVNHDGLQELFVGAPETAGGEGRIFLLFLSPGGQLQSFTSIAPDLRAYPDLQLKGSGFGSLMAVTVFDGGNAVLVAPGYLVSSHSDSPSMTPGSTSSSNGSPYTSTSFSSSTPQTVSIPSPVPSPPPSTSPSTSTSSTAPLISSNTTSSTGMAPGTSPTDSIPQPSPISVPTPPTILRGGSLGLYYIVLSTTGDNVGTSVVSFAPVMDAEKAADRTLLEFLSVVALGDLDHDTHTDIAVSTRSNISDGSSVNAVFVLYLAIDGSIRKFTRISETDTAFLSSESSKFGRSIAPLLRLDPVDTADIIIGAPGDGVSGAVHVVYLSADGFIGQVSTFSAWDGNFLVHLPPGDELGRAISTSRTSIVGMSSGNHVIRSFFVASKSTVTRVILNSINTTGTVNILPLITSTSGPVTLPPTYALPPSTSPVSTPVTPPLDSIPPPSINNAPNVEFVNVPALQNQHITPPDPIYASFGGLQPEFSIWPVSNGHISLNMSFISLEEVTPTGTVVVSVDLRAPYAQYTHIIKPLGDHWYLLTFMDRELTIEFTLTHVLNDLEVRSDADHSFFIFANSVKWSMIISRWTFRSMNNRLRLTKKFDTISPVLRVEDRLYDAEDVYRHAFFTEVSEVRITVPSLVRVDQVNLLILNTDLFKYKEKNRTMEFSFPAFFSTLRYDPDVTIIDSQGKQPVIAASSSSFVIVGATVGVIFSAVVVTVVILAVIFVFRRRSRLAKQEETWKGINYDDELGSSVAITGGPPGNKGRKDENSSSHSSTNSDSGRSQELPERTSSSSSVSD